MVAAAVQSLLATGRTPGQICIVGPSVKTREEVLSWYLDLNSGGTVHTEEELTKVRGLIETKAPYVRPSDAERHAEARVDREVIQNALRDEAEQEAKRIEASKLRDAEEAAKPKKGRVKK